MAHYVLQRLHVNSKLPEKASLSWIPKSGQAKKLLKVFHLCRVYSLFLAKTRMLSLSFLLFSSSGSHQPSSNTPHITLSKFSLEAIFAYSASGFKKIFFLSYITSINV